MIYGLIELGWAEAELGDAEGGIEKMQRGLAEYEAKLRSPYFLGLLADQLCKAGRLKEGLAVITKALTLAEYTGEGFAVSELYRIKGELFAKNADLLAASKFPGDQPAVSALSQARACFAEALTIAKQQGTRWWELRAAMSMDRLQTRQGEPISPQLADIYSFFTEGRETADLKEARARLKAAARA